MSAEPKTNPIAAAFDLSPLRHGIMLVLQSSPGWALLQLVFTAVQAAVPLVSLYLLKQIIDLIAASVTAGAVDGGQLTLWIIAAAGVAVVGAATRAGSTLITEVQSLRVGDHVQEILHAKSVELDLQFYENVDYHDALHRAQLEAPVRPGRVVAATQQVGQAALSLIGVIGLLISFHWMLITALLAAALPGLLVKTKFSQRLYVWTRRRTKVERLNRYVNTLLTSVEYAKEIRLMNLGDVFRARHRELRRQLIAERLALVKRRTSYELAAQCVAVLAVFASMFLIAQRAVAGAISVGDVVMYFGAFQRAQDFFREMLTGVSSLYENNLFLADFKRFLALEPAVVEPARPRPFPRPIRHAIEFDRVSFRYPGTDRDILRDVSLAIRPGEHVALVGANGSGKTTLVKLLCRLYDPTSGALRVDGVDLREFRVAELRSQVSVVFQDYAKYYLTARENIWLGNVALPPDSEAIVESARRTGAASFIEALPHGYDTMLGRQFENGVDPSVGQWQKLAIARAFLRTSPILILDEPTAALDPRAEAEVFDHFAELAAGRTAILISHRLSTVRRADRIFVMVDGRIAEAGPHDELVEQAGVYASLFETQAKHYR